MGHITTFGGNPVVAASALATLTEIEEWEIIKTVKYKENLFRTKLTNPKIKNIQGVGLMLALIFEEESIPDYLVHRCIKKGLLLFWLLWEKAVKYLHHLQFQKKEIIQGCKIICETLDEL